MTLYTIHENDGLRTLVDPANGFIKRTDIPVMPSANWRVRGIWRAAPFGNTRPFHPYAPLADVLEALTTASLSFKSSGKPRYFVADYDHGTRRIRMAGIIGVWLASETATYEGAAK